MSDIKAIGIDLAKEIFYLHGVDKQGSEIFKQKLSRKKLIEFMSNLDCDKNDCIIGMEACGGANYFAKKFMSLGYKNIRIVPAQFVKPYVKSNKNDEIDALAITKAILDPDMRFSVIKQDWQQDIMNIHRVRSRLIKQRTALGNEIRGLLTEYGLVFPKTISKLKKNMTVILNDGDLTDNLSSFAKETFNDLLEEMNFVEQKIVRANLMLKEIFSNNDSCLKLSKIPGIGLISATALVGEVGNASNFKNGRELSSYLGLVPRQNSSGGKTKLLGISKRGNKYLRTLMIHCSRAASSSMQRCKNLDNNQLLKNKKLSSWYINLKSKKNSNVAVVALANKLARICFVVLNKGQEYDPSYDNFEFRS